MQFSALIRVCSSGWLTVWLNRITLPFTLTSITESKSAGDNCHGTLARTFLPALFIRRSILETNTGKGET